MTLIIDASIAAKWLFEEDGSAAARALRGTAPMCAPDFLLLEVFHVMWKRVRRGEMPPEALQDLPKLLAAAFDLVVPAADLLQDAAGKARQLAHPVYDCLYITLAERDGSTLITADEKQFLAARKAAVKVRLL